jgi:hypothetical protein
MFRNLIAATLLTGLASADELDHKASIQQMGYLTGDWSETKNGVTVEEHWTGPVGNIMAGVTITHSDKPGAKTSVEFMTIELVDETLVFTARIDGQPPVAFKLKEADNGIATFENLAHDFPQRITYEIAGEMDELNARIEGVIDGKTRSMAWSYKKLAK